MKPENQATHRMGQTRSFCGFFLVLLGWAFSGSPFHASSSPTLPRRRRPPSATARLLRLRPAARGPQPTARAPPFQSASLAGASRFPAERSAPPSPTRASSARACRLQPPGLYDGEGEGEGRMLPNGRVLPASTYSSKSLLLTKAPKI